MELRVLRYFLMVAREENITRAAKLLHITQPTLSRQLMQLEDELGVKLLKRTNHSIELTDEGMFLRRRAQELLSLADKTKEDIVQEEEQIEGTISIGAGELRSMDCFAQVLAKFRQKHPLIRYDFFSGNVDNIKEQIDHGLIDLALFSEPADITKYDFIRMPIKETWGILISKDSELAKKDVVTPKDLYQVPLMTSGRELIQNEIMHWFGSYADGAHIVSTFNLMYNAVVLAQQGFAALFCIKLNVEYEGMKFVPLSPQMELGSVIAWKKAQPTSKAVNAFIKYAKTCFESGNVK